RWPRLHDFQESCILRHEPADSSPSPPGGGEGRGEVGRGGAIPSAVHGEGEKEIVRLPNQGAPFAPLITPIITHSPDSNLSKYFPSDSKITTAGAQTSVVNLC